MATLISGSAITGSTTSSIFTASGKFALIVKQGSVVLQGRLINDDEFFAASVESVNGEVKPVNIVGASMTSVTPIESGMSFRIVGQTSDAIAEAWSI